MIRFKGRENVPADTGDDPESLSDDPVEHGSPGIKKIFAALGGETAARILDLGPAVPSNIRTLSEFASHIRVADAAGDLCAPIADDDDWSPMSRAAGLLPVEVGDFDLVLAWDILNYLRKDVSDALVDRFRQRSRSGARIFTLIHEGPTMPAEPQTFEIRGNDRLAYRSSTTHQVPSPRLPPAEVERRLEGFRIEASFVLRHGIREYVAIRV